MLPSLVPSCATGIDTIRRLSSKYAPAGGGVSGGAFNPAVGVGPALVHAALGGGSLASIWIYLVGPLVGGAAAAGVFAIQHPGTGER